jgi:hypothetical protein
MLLQFGVGMSIPHIKRRHDIRAYYLTSDTREIEHLQWEASRSGVSFACCGRSKVLARVNSIGLRTSSIRSDEKIDGRTK